MTAIAPVAVPVPAPQSFRKQIAIYAIEIEEQIKAIGTVTAESAMGIIWDAIEQASTEATSATATNAEKRAFVLTVAVNALNSIIEAAPLPGTISMIVRFEEKPIDAAATLALGKLVDLIYGKVVAPNVAKTLPAVPAFLVPLAAPVVPPPVFVTPSAPVAPPVVTVSVPVAQPVVAVQPVAAPVPTQQPGATP